MDDFTAIETMSKSTFLIAFTKRKGGVTASTSAANLGAFLAQLGYRVVLVESDGQGSLSRMVGVEPHDAFYQLIADDREFSDVLVPVPSTFIDPTARGGELWLLASFRQQMSLANDPATGQAVYTRFQELRGWADYVLIDPDPAINELNSAWFHTSDYLVLPTLCERPSVDQLEAETLDYLHNAEVNAQEAGMPVAKVLGILPNRYDKLTNVDRFNIGLLHGRHGKNYTIFPLVTNAAIWKTGAQLCMSIAALTTHRDATYRKQARNAREQFQPVLNRVLALKGVAVQ